MKDVKAPREALRFHAETKGAQVRLDTRGCTAHRHATFHDGIVFSQRPVRLGERVALRPSAGGEMLEQSPTWAAILPEGCALVGDVVRFWVDRRGRLFAKVNAGCRLLLREGVPVSAPLWAVMDVYGTTKAIELLDPTASRLPTAMPWDLRNKAGPEPKATPGEECAICFYHAANTCLVPCSHTYFCRCCAWRVFRETAKCPVCRRQIEAVAPTQGPPAVRTEEGS
ncbi:hypothetical protein H8958_007807 [Nasalis larvatus]